MKQSVARTHLERMLISIQRYRGITVETLGIKDGEQGLGFSDKFLASQWPWVFGEKCPIGLLQDVLDREQIAPMDFYNFMVVLDRFMPEVKIYGEIQFKHEFPAPDIKMLGNWDKER